MATGIEEHEDMRKRKISVLRPLASIDVDPLQIRSPHTVSRHHTVQPGREISRLTVQPGREGPSERRERKGNGLPWSGNIRYPPPIVMVALQPPVSLDVDI